MIFSGQWCFPSSFENGKFCIDVGLGQGNVKQPDAHWTVRPHMLLNPQQIQNPFAINPASNRIAPELVYEVVVSNKSMPTLTVTFELVFRSWHRNESLYLFKNRNPNGIHRWWCGWARRMTVNGQFCRSPGYEQWNRGRSNRTPMSTSAISQIQFSISMSLRLSLHCMHRQATPLHSI